MAAARHVPACVLALLVAGGVALAAVRGPQFDALATEFVRIALAFAQHEPREVDSYFGPASLRPTPTTAPVPRDVLSHRAHELLEQLTRVHAGTGAGADTRCRRLRAEARALAALIDTPQRASFDDEARLVYGMTVENVDTHTERGPARAQIDAALAALDQLLPRSTTASAQESLVARFDAYRRRFAVPPNRRRAVFTAALDACRARTAAHWRLPAGEHLDVKWDIAAPAAWHRYEGRGRSMLTINPAAVEFIDTAIDLACHEGYPGHHAQFLLADPVGAPAAGAASVEETVALLRSPVAMLREGAANYAADLAFPPAERLRFERDILFPIAGLDGTTAADYFEVRRLVRALEPAIVPILRDYRDGRLWSAEAADRLERRALVSSPPALLRFVDDFGAYVLGYTVARERVADYIANQVRAGRGDAWAVLNVLLTSPDPTVLRSPPSQLPSTN